MRFPITPSCSKLPNLLTKIRDSSSNGKWEEVFFLYRETKKPEIQPIDHEIFSPVLKACLALSFRLGKSVHGSLIKQGFISFSSVGNSIIDFYAKSGELTSALGVFSDMKKKDSVSWNIILHGNLNQGAFDEGLELFNQARVAGFEPNVCTLLLVIQAYRNLKAFDDGFKFHGFLIRSGLWSLTSVQNSLLSMYTEIGMEHAETLFHEMYEKDLISWSVMIKGYVKNDAILFALESFKQMVSKIEVDGHTMVSILKGCTNLGDIRLGKSIHGFVILRGFDSDVFVGNTLVDLYSKCGEVDSAFKAFNEMPDKNIVSWNSLLCGFVHNERYLDAIMLFDSMRKSGVEADEVTLVNILQTFKLLGNYLQCKVIHSRVIKLFQANELALNSLIDAYAKCNHIDHAWKLFCRIDGPDAFTWSTMISGFTYCGMPDEAIAIYRKMRIYMKHVGPVSLLNVIEACSLSADSRKSKWAHCIAIKMGFESQVVHGTAILDMYSKIGEIKASRMVFDQISEKNIVSWSAIIAAYGLNGLPHDALNLLSEMKIHNLKPNSVTTLSILSACCHGGFLKEGLCLFLELTKNHEMKLEHYSCLVDLLARSGNLDDALWLIKSIPFDMKPNASAWGALLSASRNYESREFAVSAVSKVLELEPSNSAGYLLASNVYAAGGSWADAFGVRCLVKERGVNVIPGYSLVHVSDKAYSFTAGDKGCPLTRVLCPVVEGLHSCMKIDMGATPMVA